MHTPGPRAHFRSRRFRFTSRIHRSVLGRCALAAALILPAAVPAQIPAPPADAVQGDAALPDAPAAPPRHAALPPWPASTASMDWRDAQAAPAAAEPSPGMHDHDHDQGHGHGHHHGSDHGHGSSPAGGHRP
ncbi:hypothetical protein [Paracidovorax cattleyae]|uniref:Uncharacterized protein n=1 Tax=Paracidovorax cattleyae TaxID=80868 RepID=A0A1H0RK87_9BURK|nr:hypothetical protein [Paracidovorax cattleyae]SDP29845.1 hypothetical protein SAMN04489708_110106 [Paracidovorax cattleyae]